MEFRKKSCSVVLALIVVFLCFVIISSIASASVINVGSTSKYKTIQSAVNSAKPGDTIKVAYGTYKENVKIDKELKILGTDYPKVDGFYYLGGGGTINGFSLQKHGVSSGYAGGGLIRNNYFYNCGIDLAGSQASSVIMNNQIIGGTIVLHDTHNEKITGNTISNSKCGIYLSDINRIPTVSKNTFKNCHVGVYFYGWENDPGRLTTFTGNKYINNKINLEWGIKHLNNP